MEPLWLERFPPDEILHTRARVVEVGTWTLLRSALRDVPLKILADEADPSLSPGTEVVIFNVQAQQIDQGFELKRLSATRIGKLNDQAHWDKFIEPCSGLGALSMGAMEMGFTPCAAMDLSDLAARTYGLNHDVPCLQGNVLDGSDLWRLFEATKGKRCGLASGFPCPPFSQMGDRKGFRDERSLVFIQCLNLGYLFHSLYLVLECTPQTGQWAEVNDLLASFATALGMKVETGILHLQNSWPCRRTRWWATLLPVHAQVACRGLRDLPRVPELCMIQDAIPEWPVWPIAEEHALRWMTFEAEAYRKYIEDDQILLQLNAPCPTILHSAGHHFLPCPCGCRNFPLSAARLERDGVSTIAVWARDKSELRHLHPQEAAFLTTIGAKLNLPPGDLRQTLPLIGQLAAPLQSHWIFGQIKEFLLDAKFIVASEDFELLDKHHCLLDKLLRQRHHYWPVPSMSIPRDLTLMNPSGTTTTIRIGPFAKVGHLLHAQKELEGWGARVSLRDQDELLTDECFLHAASYSLDSGAPRQPCLLIPGQCELQIRHGDRCIQAQVNRGDFLGLHVEQAGLAFCSDPVLLSHGLCWGDRLWASCRDVFRGAGDAQDGLTTQQLIPEIEALLHPMSNWHLFPVDELTMLLEKPKIVASYHIKQHLNRLCHEQGFAPHKIVFAVCALNHWSLVIHDVNSTHTRTYDGAPCKHEALHYLIANVCGDFFGHAPMRYPPDSLVWQQNDATCGAILLVNLGWTCGLWADFAYPEVEKWYHALADQTSFTGAGAHDYATAHSFLVSFLPSRGVAPEAVADRAAQAIKKLGLQHILKAISHDNPWRQLKMLGSNASKPYQWVTADELRLHIESRASQKYGADIKKKPNKTREPRPTRPIPISAEGLKTPDGAFVDDKGKALSFIQIDILKSDCTGVTIASLDQVHRFMADSKILSTEALGMLTVERIPDNHPGTLTTEHLTWPALFGSEPLLIRGSLVQLGDKHVSLKQASTSSSTITTSLMRLQVYRDQWSADWSLFAKGPLKKLVQTFPALQICQQGKGAATCGTLCGKYHPPVDEPTELVLLDCFAWKWFNADGKNIGAPHADSFSIMVRTPAGAVESILNLAGKEGFYAELRESADSSPTYAVIWLKGSLADAQHILQVQVHALHLTRLHQKYGVRCLKKHEEALRKIIYPDTPFVACDVKILFQAGPWAHGISKQGVQEAITAMPWIAKVLKPCKGRAEGRFWLIGASDHPPANVFQHGQDWITITVTREEPPEKRTPNVVASLKTIQKLNDFHHNSGTPDPWMQKDPWSSWKKPEASYGQYPRWNSWNSTPASSAAPPMSRLTELEDSIKEAVHKEVLAQQSAKEADEPMEDGTWKSQMETDLLELKAQSNKYNEWFQTAGEQITGLQEAVRIQGGTIDTLTQSVQQQATFASGLQQQVSQIENGLRHELREATQHTAELFRQQTEHLETLLVKRSRHE